MLPRSRLLYRHVNPAQRHYVPSEVRCELLTRFTRAVKHPNPDSLFRGSLVDENMFAIDTAEWGLDDLLKESRQRSPKITMNVAERCA